MHTFDHKYVSYTNQIPCDTNPTILTNSSRFENLSRIMTHSVVSAHLSKLEVKMILIQLKHRMHSKFAPVSIKCQSPPVSVSSRTVKVKFKIGSGQKVCFII